MTTVIESSWENERLKETIESLRQQLASCQAQLADTEALEVGTGERLAKVKRQLAAALAACKRKDDALRFYKSAVNADDVAGTALTIQPDDSALKAWLGEPVARINCNGIVVIDHKEMLDGIEWLELYSPKGLK